MSMQILLLHDTPFGLSCPMWWLFSLGAFLLGLLLGWWLWYEYKKRADELDKEVKGYQVKVVDMEKDYMSLKYQYDEIAKSDEKLKLALRQCEADKAVLQTKIDHMGDGGLITGRGAEGIDYTAIFGQDHLQLIEGVGPKVEELLKKAGLATLSDVATASVDDLRAILDNAGPNYRMHDPASWPKQALLAAENHWDELIAMQKTLSAGKDTGDGDTPSKVEKLAAKLLGFSTNPEDLKIIEGVGLKIEQLLKADGINTWSDLAAASVAHLKGLLEKGGDSFRMADPSTWPKQAALAAAGNWKELSEYQEFLDGGKEPA